MVFIGYLRQFQDNHHAATGAHFPIFHAWYPVPVTDVFVQWVAEFTSHFCLRIAWPAIDSTRNQTATVAWPKIFLKST